MIQDHDGPKYAGYDEDAALQAALERSRQEAQQNVASCQCQSASSLQDDENLARALEESLNSEHHDGALPFSGNVRPLQVCCPGSLLMCKPYMAAKCMQQILDDHTIFPALFSRCSIPLHACT
jgi:hypothetical protein